ncbi:NAC domain-containing protein 72-like protein [Tanacetum coccineum]|uniref:NAC domain-containing protein 72-like protein n=1 Tax=Tanacetum coccineum TaxID=301880 RepID=A0ABQ5H604_9ASTR
MGCQVVNNVPNLCGTFGYFSRVELIDASVGIAYPFVFPYLDSEVSWMLKVVNWDVHQLCIYFNGSFLVGSNPSFLESLDQDIDKNNFLVPCSVAFAQHMGLEADAAKMKYSFEIGRAERRITLQGVPCTIRKTLAKVCKQLDAFVVPRKLLLSYMDENHVLQINARSWLEETKSDEDASVETIIFRGQDRYFPIESQVKSISVNERCLVLLTSSLTWEQDVAGQRRPLKMLLPTWLRTMVLMVKRNLGEHLIRRFAGRGNEPDPRDVKIASLKQRIQELEFSQLEQDSSA